MVRILHIHRRISEVRKLVNLLVRNKLTVRMSAEPGGPVLIKEDRNRKVGRNRHKNGELEIPLEAGLALALEKKRAKVLLQNSRLFVLLHTSDITEDLDARSTHPRGRFDDPGRRSLIVPDIVAERGKLSWKDVGRRGEFANPGGELRQARQGREEDCFVSENIHHRNFLD
jgi:hypothetical protein